MAIIKKFRIKSYKEKKPIIKLEKISLSFGKRKILDNINFSINESQILGLLGPNGVGKSTIFNLITGLIKPQYGSIIINSKNVARIQESHIFLGHYIFEEVEKKLLKIKFI